MKTIPKMELNSIWTAGDKKMIEIIATISVCINVLLIIKLKWTLDKLHRVLGR